MIRITMSFMSYHLVKTLLSVFNKINPLLNIACFIDKRHCITHHFFIIKNLSLRYKNNLSLFLQVVIVYDLHSNTLVELYIFGQALHRNFILRCITFPNPLYSTQNCPEKVRMIRSSSNFIY